MAAIGPPILSQLKFFLGLHVLGPNLIGAQSTQITMKHNVLAVRRVVASNSLSSVAVNKRRESNVNWGDGLGAIDHITSTKSKPRITKPIKTLKRPLGVAG